MLANSMKLRPNQREALESLLDGQWRYAVVIRKHLSLVSLRQRGLVIHHQDHRSIGRKARQWQITEAGRAALRA